MEKKSNGLQIVRNYAKLAVLIGILPWSYYYITALASSVNHVLGLDQLAFVKAGVYLIPIIAPPLLLFSFLSKDDE